MNKEKIKNKTNIKKKKARTPLPHPYSPNSFILCMQTFFLQEYIGNDNVLNLWKLSRKTLPKPVTTEFFLRTEWK